MKRISVVSVLFASSLLLNACGEQAEAPDANVEKSTADDRTGPPERGATDERTGPPERGATDERTGPPERGATDERTGPPER